MPEAPGIVPGDGPDEPTMLSTLGNYGFANKTGAVSVLTTGGAKLVGAFLLILNNGGLAIGNVPADRKVIILGEGGVDMEEDAWPDNNTRSIVTLLSKGLDKDIGEKLTAHIERMKDEQGQETTGSATFDNGQANIDITGNGPIWLKGGAPSGPNDGQNFKVTIKDQNGNVKKEYIFRVYNTSAAFGTAQFTVAGNPSSEDDDPFLQVWPDSVALTSGFRAGQPGYQETFKWDITTNIDQQNLARVNEFKAYVVQNLLHCHWYWKYNSGTRVDVIPIYTPMLDADGLALPAVAGAPRGTGFFNGQGLAMMNMYDNPMILQGAVTWNSPLLLRGDPGKLIELKRDNGFRDWVVIKFIKNGDHDTGATRRVYHVDWNIFYRLTVVWVPIRLIGVDVNSCVTITVNNGNGRPKMVSTGLIANKGVVPIIMPPFIPWQ